MRRLLSKRPSAGVIIGFLALSVALGGGAYAAKKKLSHKSISKEGRMKLLPSGSGVAGTGCDPTSATHQDCISTSIKTSNQFGRKMLVIANGTVVTGAAGGRAVCRIEQDGNPVAGANAQVGAAGPPHEGQNGEGFGINAITQPLTGTHNFQLACNEASGAVQIPTSQISVITLRG
jgi:hypothetical protein